MSVFTVSPPRRTFLDPLLPGMGRVRQGFCQRQRRASVFCHIHISPVTKQTGTKCHMTIYCLWMHIFIKSCAPCTLYGSHVENNNLCFWHWSNIIRLHSMGVKSHKNNITNLQSKMLLKCWMRAASSIAVENGSCEICKTHICAHFSRSVTYPYNEFPHLKHGLWVRPILNMMGYHVL